MQGKGNYFSKFGLKHSKRTAGEGEEIGERPSVLPHPPHPFPHSCYPPRTGETYLSPQAEDKNRNDTEANTRRRGDHSLLSAQQEGIGTRMQEGISLGKN